MSTQPKHTRSELLAALADILPCIRQGTISWDDALTTFNHDYCMTFRGVEIFKEVVLTAALRKLRDENGFVQLDDTEDGDNNREMVMDLGIEPLLGKRGNEVLGTMLGDVNEGPRACGKRKFGEIEGGEVVDGEVLGIEQVGGYGKVRKSMVV